MSTCNNHIMTLIKKTHLIKNYKKLLIIETGYSQHARGICMLTCELYMSTLLFMLTCNLTIIDMKLNY